MNTSNYLSYFGLALAGMTLAATVVRFFRHVTAEREFTLKMAQDEEFRRVVMDRLNVNGQLGSNPIKTDHEFRRHLISIVDRKAKSLHRSQRKVVAAALHQNSEKGRTSYLSKLVFQSAKLLRQTHVAR